MEILALVASLAIVMELVLLSSENVTIIVL